MPRGQNRLSGLQANDEAFAKFSKETNEFSAMYLETLGTISRMTIYKYLNREPINPNKEKELKRVVRLAQEKREKEAIESIAEVLDND